MSQSCAVVVHDGDDRLARAVTDVLRSKRIEVRELSSGELARAPLELTSSEARLGDRRIRAALMNVGGIGTFADGFVPSDAAFCNAETAAAWLTVLNLDSVVAVNRPDAELWFSSAEWPVWHRRLEAAGVPVVAPEVGDAEQPAGRCWMPWCGGFASPPTRDVLRCFGAALVDERPAATGLWLDGRRIGGEGGSIAGAAAAILAEHGARLAQIRSAADGSVVSCRGWPSEPVADIDTTAGAIAETLRAGLHRR